jgi:predicted ribosome quality control (RQC) complex YloA/Tae2 family protein
MIEKVDDTIIKIAFDRDEPYYFDMQRGDSYIFRVESYKRSRDFNSPFDVVLKKRFTNAFVEKIEILEGNRVLQIFVNSSSKYKAQKSVLQFEFTGRNTNVIILDENGVILEAFRHIDLQASFRQVKVGIELKPLAVYEIKESAEDIEDIDLFFIEEYRKREKVFLHALKKQKILLVDKKLKKLDKLYDRLEDEESLKSKSDLLQIDGNLILSNIHNMNNYQKEVTVLDYDGNSKVIKLPDDIRNPSQVADWFFTRSKKLKQKAKHTYLERENLESKIEFLQRLKQSIKNSKTKDEINLYFPKQSHKRKTAEKENINVESFFIQGYKLTLGKNEKGNISVLKDAKMSDIWMHIKDIPSTHVIIRNSKKSVPELVLKFGAKLCVQFSSVNSGSYLVDYTPRRNVKMRDGAHVNYVEYKTIKAIKE